METVPITVAIPVGPFPQNKRWLREAVESVVAQDPRPSEVLLVDDMADLSDVALPNAPDVHIRRWLSPWRLGVAHGFNFCVALAKENNVLMMGSDDMLLPGCLAECMKVLKAHNFKDAYYWLGIQFNDGRPDQYVPVNAAVTTKGFWKLTGGFPPESAVGAPDSCLTSIIEKHFPKLMIPVSGHKPLYWYRDHPESFTLSRHVNWMGIRAWANNTLLETYSPPSWGRY